MNKKDVQLRKLAGAILVGCVVPAASFAAVDAFLKIDGIEGESTRADHKGEIDVYSWSWGMDRPSTQGAGMSMLGRPCISELYLMKRLDKASPKLMGAVQDGRSVGKARLSLVQAGEGAKEFFFVEMSNVQVSSLQISGSSEQPMESVALRFGSANISYKPQDDKGGLGGAVPVMIKAGTC